jgi:hypothetical protein
MLRAILLSELAQNFVWRTENMGRASFVARS